jgi:ubiquitin carboxyl-terminal hydrolase 8
MEIKEVKQDIPSGVSTFVNIGNTCYLNATLQCLMATDSLVKYFTSDTYKDVLKKNVMKKFNLKEDDITLEEKYKNTLTYHFKNVINMFWKFQSTLKPIKFKELLSKISPIFRGHSQNDSHEAFHYIVDTIHEETKINVRVKFNVPEEATKVFVNTLEQITDVPTRIAFCNANLIQYMYIKSQAFFINFIKNNYSVIFNTFMGTTVNAIRCSKCNNTAIIFETFTSLSVPINGCNTLFDCLNNFIAPRSLSGDEQYKCDICKEKVDATYETKIWNLGEKFVIHLKRFTNSTQKNDTPISFPIEHLDMSPYCCEFKNEPIKRIYNLYGIIQHFGSAQGGHYIAYTKNKIDEHWYEFNDEDAYLIPNIESVVSTSNSFILFYERHIE